MDYNKLLFANVMRERATQFRNQASKRRRHELETSGLNALTVEEEMIKWQNETPGDEFIEMALKEVQGVAAVIDRIAK
ncbi:hypothetical protein [Janthinobacterium sp. HLS12-2]|uniref:hypothetical protein n=1 Tax=Janthinobacterium sp. HLS12-2 TaxID=1259324 RepID=UPI003F1F070E